MMRIEAPSRTLPCVALALALCLSACTGMRWQKTGGDDAALAQDLAACRKQAQVRFGGAARLGMPSSTDPRFGPTGPSQTELLMQENQAVGTCMRGKGYALVEDK